METEALGFESEYRAVHVRLVGLIVEVFICSNKKIRWFVRIGNGEGGRGGGGGGGVGAGIL